MSGMWLSRIIILPYCEKGPWRRRWQRKPGDGTIVTWLLNSPIIQIFDHQIFDQIQSHQTKYQYFCQKCQQQVGRDVHLLLAMPPARKSSSESNRSGRGGELEREEFENQYGFSGILHLPPLKKEDKLTKTCLSKIFSCGVSNSPGVTSPELFGLSPLSSCHNLCLQENSSMLLLKLELRILKMD